MWCGLCREAGSHGFVWCGWAGDGKGSLRACGGCWGGGGRLLTMVVVHSIIWNLAVDGTLLVLALFSRKGNAHLLAAYELCIHNCWLHWGRRPPLLLDCPERTACFRTFITCLDWVELVVPGQHSGVVLMLCSFGSRVGIVAQSRQCCATRKVSSCSAQHTAH